MAQVCCVNHRRRLHGDGELVGAVPAKGYPDTAAICFEPGCGEPGEVWLEQHELDAWTNGERIFSASLPERFMKVRVEEPGEGS